MGPMSATISPSATFIETSFTAIRPPKRRSTFCTSSMSLTSRFGTQFAQQPHDAFREQHDNANQDQGVHHQVGAGAEWAEPVFEEFLQGKRDRGTDQGTEDRADTAQNGHQSQINRDRE